ncbi:MAG: beta-N-acetylhexosaminidase [Rhodospirillaceae bacterium]|nr:beta-N-acetylhexosaminidase [Rhodospirillaceae bacterium]HAA91724.1 beta-N-acetylhexosaminidase [Rhodospirillaceae bacterium]
MSPPASGTDQKTAPNAVIFGCAGLELTSAERAFFGGCNPLGLILFARNIETPDQVRALTSEFADVVAYATPLILIDQEGGRVARLGPPHWRDTLPAKVFGDRFQENRKQALTAARLNAEIQALDLAMLGINVNCTPVADLAWPDTHEIIGDRAFSNEAKEVAALARAVCEGHLAAGVMPVVKHVPGHGRATADSHLELPVVDASREELEASDFDSFRLLADMPAAMTAHIVYSAFDDVNPATQSSTVITDVIRNHIGFDGLLMSDDLGMKALGGDFDDRARRSLAAGCDVALHCSGDFDEMVAVADGVGALDDVAIGRLERALLALSQTAGAPVDRDDLLNKFATLMAR